MAMDLIRRQFRHHFGFDEDAPTVVVVNPAVGNSAPLQLFLASLDEPKMSSASNAIIAGTSASVALRKIKPAIGNHSYSVPDGANAQRC
jgi:hypothetical protein